MQNDTRRRLCCWRRGNGNSAGLPIGEQRPSPAQAAPNVCADCQPNIYAEQKHPNGQYREAPPVVVTADQQH
jgi:hypothetical protein